MSGKKNWAKRIQNLPPYLFAEIDRLKAQLRRDGVDVIDLSIGDPDLPTPKGIIEKLDEEARKPENHRYPSYVGSQRFRQAVARWYEERFQVSVDPETEVIALIGSKEGIAHMPLAYINPGDLGLIPDPGYPVYETAISFAGGESVKMPLKEENGYFPDLSKIDSDTANRSKLLFFNYPNNPTSAIVQRDRFDEIVSFCKEYDVLACHDAAYTEVTMGDLEPRSYLQSQNAKSVGVEFHSLSKTFNMTGWRVAFAVGQSDAIAALGKIKTNVDSGVFGAIQEAGIYAMENWRKLRDDNNRIYEKRRDLIAAELKDMGLRFDCRGPRFTFGATFPKGKNQRSFCSRMLQEAGLSFTPGVGFGDHGEGYFRIALTASDVRLQEAMARLRKAL